MREDFNRAVRDVAGFPKFGRAARNFEEAGGGAGAKFDLRIDGVGDRESVHGERVNVDAGRDGADSDGPNSVRVARHRLPGVKSHPIAEETGFTRFRSIEAEGNFAVAANVWRGDAVGLGLRVDRCAETERQKKVEDLHAGIKRSCALVSNLLSSVATRSVATDAGGYGSLIS
jgi:hypothetical protein